MNLSDLRLATTSTRPVIGPATNGKHPLGAEHWPELVASIGAEIAGPLTAAIERINTLARTGTIDRAGLRALREEVEAARQAGLVGQQLVRFDNNRIRQSPERMQLLDVLNGVVTHRNREALARGAALVIEPAAPVEVVVDAPLLFSLLNAIVDWALIDAGAAIEFSVEDRRWPATARVRCRYAPRQGDAAGSPDRSGREPLAWRLVEELARVLGIAIERRNDAAWTTLTIDFQRSIGSPLAGVDAIELDDGFSPSSNSQPLAGSHVLVIASRRELRTEIRDALRRMSLIVDFVNSVEEAVEFCRDGLPHAVLIESIQVGERFAALRADIGREVPDFVFIEILEEGTAFEVSGYNGATMARVGREVLQSSLPSALLFELAHTG